MLRTIMITDCRSIGRNDFARDQWPTRDDVFAIFFIKWLEFLTRRAQNKVNTDPRIRTWIVRVDVRRKA